MDLIHPHSKRDVVDALRAASAAETRVLVVGGRQHIDKGNPSEVDAELWTTLLDDRVAYDPAEMLCVAEAGMRIHDLRTMLADGGQEWPVDAPDDATVGGVIATGGPTIRQLRVGTMRDTVVEMEVVTGDGRLIKSGARTVKNVTGYDVHRLLTGSLGTLGAIVQVALKVRPLPKSTRTLVIDEGGVELGRRVLDAVPLPAAVLAESDRLVVRLEGWPEEVEEQTAAARSIATFDEIDDPFPEACFPEATIVAEAAAVPSRLAQLLDGVDRYRAMIGVGIAWVPFEDEEALTGFRSRAGELGGIAPVIRGPGGLGRGAVPAPQVQQRVRTAMDPTGILAPGRGWST
ncbi:MAG: FAD-binding protein [Actinomycetota bacterium]|nr:FAD-binding protein [Actinomycetota bacterium]MDP9327585.1 FAD-binding protein [Actinomycetota bacterium]